MKTRISLQSDRFTLEFLIKRIQSHQASPEDAADVLLRLHINYSKQYVSEINPISFLKHIGVRRSDKRS
jgi:hypothetical protein